ncbi:unnamed protein product [Effrenium voratum]|uniref:Uncharacterized protein n=2 Tax=Effrenium voratum TaxID=2562239 RepID=A0AA36N2I3_9DINO|nr:unnamed protein product [Effrenium voratum]
MFDCKMTARRAEGFGAALEAEEATELAQMKTQLLQTKLELQPTRDIDLLGTEDGDGLYYGKLMTNSPHWCGHIPWIVQFVVPPCWFGKPDNTTLGPDGKPQWCTYVHGSAKPYVKDCNDRALGGTPTATQPPPPIKTRAKPAKPDWCNNIPEAQKKFAPDCNDAIQSLWLRQREANFAYHPVLLEAAAETDSSAGVFYGRVMTSSPHWCGYIPWLVQFVVPPCWFGKPGPSDGPLGPDGKPEWCKWVSPSAIHYVPDCRTPYDNGAVLGAAPPPVKKREKPAVKPDWCTHVPQESMRYVPDCSSDVESLWLGQA